MAIRLTPKEEIALLELLEAEEQRNFSSVPKEHLKVYIRLLKVLRDKYRR